MSVIADQGAGANGLDFENSHWVFRGNVKITMEQGQLTSDEADITFANKLLAKAVVNGKPAAFEQRIAKTGKLAQRPRRYHRLRCHQARGAVIQERLVERRPERDPRRIAEVQRDGAKYRGREAEQGSQRVHIIITPPPKPKP